MKKKAMGYAGCFLVVFSIIFLSNTSLFTDVQSNTTYTPIFTELYGNDNISDPIASQWDQSEIFFNDSYVHDIWLTFDDSDWYNTLYDSHNSDEDDPYFSVDFEAEGIVLNNTGINMKGDSSFRGSDLKKSFRLDFNYYDDSMNFLGLKKLNLNNGWSDPTMLREKLMYDFAGQYTATSRCVYTRLYINGEYYGLYLAVEHIDTNYVQNQFGLDEDGNIFRAEYNANLEYLGEDQDDYEECYELKTNNAEDDWSGLINFIDVLNTTNIEDMTTEVEKVLDVDSALYAIAMLNLFVSMDSYYVAMHNYYMYEREDTGQFVYLLWDCNMAFGTFTMGLDANVNVYELDPFWMSTTGVSLPQDAVDIEPEEAFGPPPNGPPNDGPGGDLSSGLTNRPLMERLWAVEEYNQTYLKMLYHMVTEGGFNVGSMGARIEELSELIQEDYYADPNKDYSNSEIAASLYNDIDGGDQDALGLIPFIEQRSEFMIETVEDYATSGGFSLDWEVEEDKTIENFVTSTELCINEIMAKNSLITAPDSSETPDWIELYNTGDEMVNLSGMYLVNDFSSINAWQFPENVTIEGGEYLLIWADGTDLNENSSDLHASFSLDGNGENLGIVAEDGKTVLDFVSFEGQIQDYSYARIPDGDSEWQEYTLTPTPGESNIVNEVEVIIEEEEEFPYVNIALVVCSIATVLVVTKIYEKRHAKHQNVMELKPEPEGSTDYLTPIRKYEEA